MEIFIKLIRFDCFYFVCLRVTYTHKSHNPVAQKQEYAATWMKRERKYRESFFSSVLPSTHSTHTPHTHTQLAAR